MKVELSTYEEAPKTIQEEIDNLILEQKYKRERMNDSYVYQLDYDSEVKKWNKYLSSPKKPKRIYHFDNDSLSWGRVYGNFIDNVPNLYKPLLLINGEQTISIDIKSTLLQLYVLNYHKDVPNKQDFYEYEGLKGIIDRDHIKLLSQCLNYNETLSKALVSYNNSCFANFDSSNSLKKDTFNEMEEKAKAEEKKKKLKETPDIFSISVFAFACLGYAIYNGVNIANDILTNYSKGIDYNEILPNCINIATLMICSILIGIIAYNVKERKVFSHTNAKLIYGVGTTLLLSIITQTHYWDTTTMIPNTEVKSYLYLLAIFIIFFGKLFDIAVKMKEEQDLTI